MAISERSGEGKTYITLQYLSRLALWVYFRNIKVICRAPVPAEGPLLIAANHSNMVLDPIVLIATFPHSRPCHFWALARFFRIPIAGHILKAAGVLPVDTKTHSNAKLFEHTLQSLDRGAVVALFPEGTSYTAPNHLPFKDGISWASFEYLSQLANKHQQYQEQQQQKENGLKQEEEEEDGDEIMREEGGGGSVGKKGKDETKQQQEDEEEKKKKHHIPSEVKIIPVGITYSTKNRWRSEVVVEYGEPIIRTLDDLEEFQNEPKAVVKKLTDTIAKGVENSTINSPDWDTTNAAREARFILFGDSRGVRLEEFVHVSQSFITLFHPENIESKDSLYSQERLDLKEKLLLFSKKLSGLRLNAYDISMYENHEITLTRATMSLVSHWMTLVLQIPLFLPGMIINSPFYILGRLIDSYEPYTESVAQDKLIFSFFLGLPVYGILVYTLWKATGYGLFSLVGVLMLLPLFAWYHMALIDKNYDMLKQVVASYRIFIAIVTGTIGLDSDWTHNREALEACVHLRRWCRDHTKQLIYKLAQAGDAEAVYLLNYGKPLFKELEKDE